MTVKVKPLVWEGSDADYTRADCVFGKFEIINTFQDVGFALHCAGSKSVSYYVSLEAAKAAAQADYDARILAALETDQTALTAIERAAYERGVQDAVEVIDERLEGISTYGEWAQGWITGVNGARKDILALLTQEGR